MPLIAGGIIDRVGDNEGSIDDPSAQVKSWMRSSWVDIGEIVLEGRIWNNAQAAQQFFFRLSPSGRLGRRRCLLLVLGRKVRVGIPGRARRC
jgi:hypothetical protein